MTEKEGYSIHQDLIAKCRQGDRRAQGEIYRLYYLAMYNTCLRILNDRVEAEDAMQEAFLAAFLKIDTYRGEMSFGSWLKKIVINKAIDLVRARKVKFEVLDEKIVLEDESDAEFGSLEENNLLITKIRNAVSILPEGFRVVLSLSLFEGFDHEEISTILGISESTSRSQLARAKKKLIEYLKRTEHEKD
jgi:RNA polymerase sigma-70 factor (ECF subfamily)